MPQETQQEDRIINMVAAQRMKERAHGFHISHLPFVPFRSLGSRMERGMVAVDQKHLLDKAKYYMSRHEKGFRPLFGGLGIGTGFTLGVEYYRNDFLRPGGQLAFPVRVSSLLYQDYRVKLALPVDGGRRFYFDTEAAYSVRTQDDFFGLGNDSRVQDRTSYMLQSREAFFGARAELKRQVRSAFQFGYKHTNVLNGKDVRFPVISALFSPTAVPGLADGAREWMGRAELEQDTRDVAAHPRHGGYHRLAAEWHESAAGNDFGFWRYEAEAERFLPLWSRNRVLALRFLGITNQPRGGSSVPFFEQAVLGGSQTLRGFREFRFRDLSAVLMTAEYRYNLNAYMDVILLLDEGQVARQPGDFSWDGLRAGYGAGLRFLTSTGTPFKIVLGRSHEGMRIYFSLGASF
jgi:outer membrane protein assembly factor BamA